MYEGVLLRALREHALLCGRGTPVGLTIPGVRPWECYVSVDGLKAHPCADPSFSFMPLVS